MKSISRAGWLAYGLAILVIALDQMAKAWVLRALPFAGASAPMLGPLRLTLVENKGVSYGFLSSDAAWTPWALAGFSLAVAIALAVWARRAQTATLGLALGLIMGGAVGNLVDRIARGAVVDFLDAQALHFPWVFNVADSAITVGIVIMVAENLLTSRAEARA